MALILISSILSVLLCAIVEGWEYLHSHIA